MPSINDINAAIDAVDLAGTDVFTELVTTAKLDSKKHFRYANWNDVDFSGQDLRSFDFTGALLNNCNFENAKICGASFEAAEVEISALRQASDWEAFAAEIEAIEHNTPSSEATAPEHVYLGGLPTPVSTFVGREGELRHLATAWTSTAPGADPSSKTNVFVLHAIGGAGKSATLRRFLDTLAYGRFNGADKVYAWSAYSQGSGDNRTANADTFIAEALTFFGYAGPTITDTVERARKLAEIVAGQRALVILDGLEPLQELPHVNGGRLKDRGLAALITGLAARNRGLLLITSRQPFPELNAHGAPRVISYILDRIDQNSGVKLLSALGVGGKRPEMESAVAEVLGHPLSLNLLGAYLSMVHGGDVNQRKKLHLREIEDSEHDFVGGATARYAKRAARIMEATMARLGEAETVILYMVGLFDRPAEREALEALLAEPAIPGLTDVFHEVTQAQRKARWNVAVERLRKLNFIAAEDRHQPGALDAHPIVRAHFGDQLKARAPEGYAQAHSRLYDFYRNQGIPQAFHTPEPYSMLVFGIIQADKVRQLERTLNAIASGNAQEEWRDQLPPTFFTGSIDRLRETAALIGTPAFGDALTAFLPRTLDDMRSCFAAIAHGCAAGRYEEAYREVYFPRVRRGNEAFIVHKLGAPNADLAALAHFFDTLWSTPAAGLRDRDRARLLNFAAFALRALGRLREALEPMVQGFKADFEAHDWENAARDGSNVSQLRLTLGDVGEAIAVANVSIGHADKSGAAFTRMSVRTTLADALHQNGGASKALAAFVEAEAMQAEGQPSPPRLYSLQGYRYCDLLLAMGQSQAAIERASNNLETSRGYTPLLSLALDHLTLGCAHAMRAVDTAHADGAYAAQARMHLDAAVGGLRRAGQEDYLPRGLLARAAFRRSQGDFAAAAADLTEAQDIASRGAMRLHLAAWHLESARLALAQLAVTSDASLRAEAETHHAEAAKLIAATGYKRRLPELNAIRACLDGAIPASLLAPDRDSQGRPIWHNLATS